jgi:hypothetical protein
MLTHFLGSDLQFAVEMEPGTHDNKVLGLRKASLIGQERGIVLKSPVFLSD